MLTNELESMNALLNDVQMSRVFPDGKTFVDCTPKFSEAVISKKYREEKIKSGFNLEQFVLQNFELPVPHAKEYTSNNSKSVTEHIEALWAELTREPDKAGGSLIPLPYPYIVPGGRFGEIYYWDSYFTMLGLAVSGRTNMIENMINNFSYLIDLHGYIPNGNRNYFLGRSQPPFYSLMIKLLASLKGETVIEKYLPYLEKEYAFWMKGLTTLSADHPALQHIVMMPGGEILNRYWDENDTARPESFREDVELAHISGTNHADIFRHLRAGAESGWDYSCRWFRDKKAFETIHTTNIIPVDLNCLLVHLEETIAVAFRFKKNETSAMHYEALAEKRNTAIQKYCWNDAVGFYFDYDMELQKQKDIFSLAAVYPLFQKIASKEQASKVAAILEQKFLHVGGLISTLETTGQQWDAPNGWAPLHWISVIGLENYGHNQLASSIAERWIKLCSDVFNRTGKLMEKYNVTDTHLEAGGGEYPGQDGFGWTNGVLLALIKKFDTNTS